MTVLLFVLAEGVASTTIFLRDFLRPNRPQGGAWAHTQPDEELGWTHRPNVIIPDLYGDGRSFRTNSQGFRGDVDFAIEEPPEKVRVICSGDSFTLGHGVSNEHTWCAQLGALDPRLETVNMGQVGYGLGQAWLWYRRDGLRLEHSAHIFGFITADFSRMRRDHFLGYPKPRLEVSEGRLVTRNVPARGPGFFPLSEGRVEAVRGLATVRAVGALARGVGLATDGEASAPPEADAAPDEPPDSVSRELVIHMLEALTSENRESGRVLVLLYLPVRSDRDGDHRIRTEYGVESSSAWRRFLAEEAQARGIVLIDLIQWIQTLDPEEIGRMYLTGGEEGIRTGRGHLSGHGNRRVAEVVYERLQQIPELSNRLGPPRP